jgi:hypothetical protein
MKLEGKKVILETKDCSCTWRGTPGLVAKRVACPTCKGTGRGVKGGRDGCKKCHGFRTAYSDTENVTCSACNGTARVPENSCDTMPDEMYLGLPFKVYRHARQLTYGESLLGWGCVYSCEDYGTAYHASDEKILADVRAHLGVQLCKVANKELELCDHIGIFIAANGYSVRAVYRADGLDAIATIASERSYSDGMVTGLRIAANGGNGTLGGIFK